VNEILFSGNTLCGKIVNREPLFIRATLALILLVIGSMVILCARHFDREPDRNIGMSCFSFFTSPMHEDRKKWSDYFPRD
jgi:hypothetical protein